MTLLEKFKKDHPNGKFGQDGTPKICPLHVGYASEEFCLFQNNGFFDCVSCWNREYKGEDNHVETVEESKSIADKIVDVYNNFIDRGLNAKVAHSIVLHLIDRGCFEK